jgi:hypothetical protein
MVQEIGPQIIEALRLQGLTVQSINLSLEPGTFVQVHVHAAITYEQLDALLEGLISRSLL